MLRELTIEEVGIVAGGGDMADTFIGVGGALMGAGLAIAPEVPPVGVAIAAVGTVMLGLGAGWNFGEWMMNAVGGKTAEITTDSTNVELAAEGSEGTAGLG